MISSSICEVSRGGIFLVGVSRARWARLTTWLSSPRSVGGQAYPPTTGQLMQGSTGVQLWGGPGGQGFARYVTLAVTTQGHRLDRPLSPRQLPSSSDMSAGHGANGHLPAYN